jgi:hypothetical protein
MKRLYLFTLFTPFFLLALLGVSTHFVFAQTFTGDILGTVSDQQGGIIPGVEVTLRNVDTNATQTVVSSDDGRYIFVRLDPGTYEVSAELAGFKKFTALDLSLRVGTRLTLNIVLEVGEITTLVEVSATEEIIQTEDVTLGQVLNEDQIVELPLNGRNFIQLAQLSPGVLQIHSAISPVSSWTSRSDMSVVVAGLRETDTSYLLDGIESRSPRWGGSGFRPSVDTIQEFNVQRNAFTADQGWGTTVVNTVIKSGTNEFHGSGFWFIRDTSLNARNFFDDQKAPYKQNQFGATFGGPIVEDKVFFFGSYEGYRERLSLTYQGRVPSQENMAGIFDEEITDPTTGQPFPDNRIPPERLDPVMQNVAAFYPEPNQADPSLNYKRVVDRPSDRDEIHLKVDFNFGESDRMFVRYSWVDEPLTQPSLFEGFGLNRPLGDHNVSITYNHFFGPGFVNEFRLGYNRNKTFSTTEAAFGEDLARQIGLDNTTTNPANFALPGFGPVGYSSIGQGYAQTQETVDNLFQINENVTYVTGDHSIKFGADLRPRRFAITNDFPSAPSFTFDGYFTGNSLADFALGLFDFTNQSIGDSSANFKNTDIALYFQDDWKVTPSLNLHFGLRYEYFQPMSEENNKLNYLDLNTLEYVNVQGPLFPPDRNNFAPRIGLAYSPTEKTVIRAGYGIFYDLIAFNETQFWGVSNPPNTQIASFRNPRPTPIFQVANMYPPPEFIPSTSPNTTDPNNRTPYVGQYNVNVQRDVMGFLIEAGYVGSTGVKLNRRVMQNMPPPIPGVDIADRRPYPGFGDILMSNNNGWSNYNGFNLRVEKPFRSGYSLLLAYTLGKALDIGGPDEYVHGDVTGIVKELRGPASLDSRHRLVTSFILELPFGQGRKFGSDVSGAADALIGGWQLTGIVTLMSGQAKTPQVGTDWARIGGRRQQPASRIGPGNNSSLKGDIRNQPVLFPYFDVNDFVFPPDESLGDGGRGTIIGPGVNNWDFGLQKRFIFTERVSLQFRAEFFNIFNHAQFVGLGMSLLDPNFGRITSARSPRYVQFGFKLRF